MPRVRATNSQDDVKHIRTQQGEISCSAKWRLFSLQQPLWARLHFRPPPRRPGATATGGVTTGAGAVLALALPPASWAERLWRMLASNARLSPPPMARRFVG